MAPNRSYAFHCRLFRQGQFDGKHGYHRRFNLPTYIAGRQSEMPWVQTGDIYGKPFYATEPR